MHGKYIQNDFLAFNDNFLDFGLSCCHKLVCDWISTVNQVVDEHDEMDFDDSIPVSSGRG